MTLKRLDKWIVSHADIEAATYVRKGRRLKILPPLRDDLSSATPPPTPRTERSTSRVNNTNRLPHVIENIEQTVRSYKSAGLRPRKSTAPKIVNEGKIPDEEKVPTAVAPDVRIPFVRPIPNAVELKKSRTLAMGPDDRERMKILGIDAEGKLVTRTHSQVVRNPSSRTSLLKVKEAEGGNFSGNKLKAAPVVQPKPEMKHSYSQIGVNPNLKKLEKK